MSQFQLEQSSVIKTAPPGSRALDFPKTEPLDLAPLTQVQADLKMQGIDYYQGYSRLYPEMYLNPAQSTLVANPTSQLFYQQQVDLQSYQPTQAEWMNTYYPAGTATSAGTTIQVPAATAVSVAAAAARAGSIQYAPQESAVVESRVVYKAADLPSPVDSGIGADLSLLTQKDDFFPATSDCSQLERPERALSHRESPLIIPKLHNSLGFQYVLEAPISTSIRKEDDRMTYVNKGQFYTVSLDYIPDPCKPLKSVTVKSQLMIVFRDDKSYEEEIKNWQIWHYRQHSPKQRILEVDSKNSSGMIGQIEEIGHNGVQFFWNPSEQTSVKISIAVQCLSTDFSNQKGVKGLPLHIQIDTFDGDSSDNLLPFHRGYAQIKVFCDKGAERKLRDEDKRAQKRKIAGSLAGRKKSDGEYHEPCERSEFYHMRDLEKRAAIFVPPDDFDPRSYHEGALAFELDTEPHAKRPRPSERGEFTPVMLYMRKREEQIFEPLHIVPPTLQGLAEAVAPKFGIEADKITCMYKRCLKGITVKMDEDMLRLYCNEDIVIVDLEAVEGAPGCYIVALTEQPLHSLQQQPQHYASSTS